MLAFLLRRLALAGATVFLVVTIGFVLGRLTGAPGALLLPDNASSADVDALNARLGFDRPVLVQYLDFLRGVVVGDLGDSYRLHESALGLVWERLPATVELAFWAFLAGFALALAAAVIIHLSGSKALRAVVGWLGATRQAVPDFFFALLLVLIFSVSLGLLPSLGRTSPASLVLPVVTLATGQFVMYLRLLDAALSDQAGQDYVRTAFAIGQSRPKILFTQMLPNALPPVLGMAGLNLGGLLGGTVVVEVVFAWPGLGSLLTDAVSQRDFPIVQAGLLFVAVAFVVVNTLVDLLVARIDPERLPHDHRRPAPIPEAATAAPPPSSPAPASAPSAVVGAAMLAVVVATMALRPLLPGFDPFGQDLSRALLPPFADAAHPLGTDPLGRDLLSRIALASAVTLGITVAIVCLNAVIGTTVGILAGFFGGRIESALSVLSNTVLAMPVVLLLIAVCAVVPPSAGLTILVVGCTWWVGYARVTRNVAAALRSQDFVVAPRTQGADRFWSLTRHVLPNVWPHTLIIAATDIATIVLIEASLEYLGLGVQPPTPSWGAMIYDGQKYLATDPWLVILPGVAMFLAVGGVQFLSQQFTAEARGAFLRKGARR